MMLSYSSRYNVFGLVWAGLGCHRGQFLPGHTLVFRINLKAVYMAYTLPIRFGSRTIQCPRSSWLMVCWSCLITVSARRASRTSMRVFNLLLSFRAWFKAHTNINTLEGVAYNRVHNKR